MDMRVNDLYNNKVNTNTISLNSDTSASAFFTEGSVVEGVVTECDNKKATVLFDLQKENAASFDGKNRISKSITFSADSVKNAEVGQLRQFRVLSASNDKVVLKDITAEKTDAAVQKMSFMDIDPSLPQMIEDFEETNGTKEKEDNDNIRKLSDADTSELKQEGMNLEKFASERLSRAIDRIKMMRSIKAENIEKTVENRRAQNEAIAKTAVKKVAQNPVQQRIAEALVEADLPVTKENIESLERAADSFSKVGRISMDSIYYLVKNQAAPTVSNIYRAAFAGVSAYYPLAEGDWKQLAADAQEIIAQAADMLKSDAQEGIAQAADMLKSDVQEITSQAADMLKSGERGRVSIDVNLTDARRLIEHDIPLTKENLVYMKKLESLKTDPELAVDAGIRAMKNGKNADEGLLIDSEAEKEAAQTAEVRKAYTLAADISDNAIKLYFRRGMKLAAPSLQELSQVQKEIETNPSTAAQLTAEFSVKEINTRLMLEEIRLSMTVEAGRRMMAKGISIATDGLEKVVDALRETKQEMYRSFFEMGDRGASEKVVEAGGPEAVLASVDESLHSIEEAPVSLLGETLSRRHEITLQELAQRGRDLRIRFLEAGGAFEKIGKTENRYSVAADAYENGSTQIRRDLGDSIKKAFSNMDSLLEENGIELTEANRRAVRILGYNGIEINNENIGNIKYYDAKVTGLVDRMTPQVVLEMVERGINPLDRDIDSLTGLVDEIRDEIGYTSEEKFSSFLVRLEESGSISESERNGYIGIYRILYQLEKNDGAAIGAAVRSGKQLTLGNLLTEVRSAKRTIDVDIDDDTKQKESHYINSITDQINESITYSRSLIKGILSNLEPEAWSSAMRGSNPSAVTLEELAEKLERADGEAGNGNAGAEDRAGRLNAESAGIREIMEANEGIKDFLTAFNTADSVANITSCAAEFGIPLKKAGKPQNDKNGGSSPKTDENGTATPEIPEDGNGIQTGISVSRSELLEGLSGESEIDELLGIKTRLANSLIGQAFETSAMAIAARSLTEQADRLGLLNRLGENGHYRFTVEDEEKKANINLTLIRNTGDAGTLSIQLKMEDYSITSDISLVVMENRYVGEGRIYCDNRAVLPELAGKLEEFKRSLHGSGIEAGEIKLAQGTESESRYIGRIAAAKRTEDRQGRISTGTLYRAARSFVASFL